MILYDLLEKIKKENPSVCLEFDQKEIGEVSGKDQHQIKVNLKIGKLIVKWLTPENYDYFTKKTLLEL